MLNGLLVYTREDAAKNEDFIQWMLDEAEKVGMKLDFFYREDLYTGIEDGKTYLRNKAHENIIRNFAIIRCIDPLFTRQLELLGIKTFNSAIIAELCNDKAKTNQVASMLGIPTADTLFVAEHQTPNIVLPYVQKSRGGRGGKDVSLIEKETPAGQNMIAQKLATPGKDVRAFIIGKEIVGAVLRTSETEFRANYSLGGKAELFTLSEKETSIVERLVSMFEFGFVGIDFIYDDKDEPMLNEIEDVVGSRTLSKLTDINTANLYLKFIKQTLLSK